MISSHKGKTYEQIMGKKKAKQLKKIRSETFKKYANSPKYRFKLYIRKIFNLHKSKKTRYFIYKIKRKIMILILNKKNRIKGKTYEQIYGYEKAQLLKLMKSKNTKGRISPLKGKTYEEIYDKKTAKYMHKIRSGKNNSSHKLTDEAQLQKSIKLSKNKNNSKCANYLHGWYIDKNKIKHYYNSSYELIRMKFLDKNNIKFLKKHGHFVIWYDKKNKRHVYSPDLLINNKILEEIKPYNFRNDKNVLLKEKYAKVYCKDNNLQYRIVTEKELEKK